MRLEKIVWPVFRLGEKEPQRDDGVIYYATEYSDLDTSEHTATFRVVDDKSVAGDTLSRRRLRLAVDNVPLFPIRQALYFLGDLLKVAKPTTWFIDSQGQLFQHQKNAFSLPLSPIKPVLVGGKMATQNISQKSSIQPIGVDLKFGSMANLLTSIPQP